MAPKKFPDGWCNYHPIKEVFPDARIVPFKTPLPGSKFDSAYDAPHRWTTYDLMDYLPPRGWELGLIIDFTYKYPAYYNPEDFVRNGIDFVKIGCVGHDVPNEMCCRQFSDVVETFLSNNRTNNRVIGVHCTHGINRTGYMLCRYLIDKLRYHPEQAIQCFAEKRGYPIERENYLQALRALPPQ